MADLLAAFGSLWALLCSLWIPLWHILMPLDTLLAPFGGLGCNPPSVGCPFGYLLIPSDTLLEVHMGPFLPHFLLILSKFRRNLLIFEGFGVGGEKCTVSTRTFSATHSFSIKLTDWHGAALLFNLDKIKNRLQQNNPKQLEIYHCIKMRTDVFVRL